MLRISRLSVGSVLILLLISRCISLAASSPLPASQPITAAEAVKIAQTVLEIPTAAGEPRLVLISRDPAKTSFWRITWDTNDVEGVFQASIDALTREILTYHHEPGAGVESQLFRYDWVNASDLAEAFLTNVLSPEKMEQLRLDPAQRGSAPSFHWTRWVNDIPFADNGAAVTLDRATGRVRDYQLNWDDVQFPAADPSVTMQTALKSFEQALSAPLAYKRMTVADSFSSTPVYVNNLQLTGLDAITGRLLELNSQSLVNLSPKPAVAGNALKPTPLADTLSQAKSLELLRKALPRDTSAAPLSSACRLTPDGTTLWSFTWSLPPGAAPGTSLTAVVDASRGVISQFSYDGLKRPDPWMTPIGEFATSLKATSILNQLRPDLVGQVQLLAPATGQKVTVLRFTPSGNQYTFARVANGVFSLEEGVRIAVDPYRSEVTHFEVTWSQASFNPIKPLVVSGSEALQKLRSELKPALAYVRSNEPVKNGEQPPIRLVYRPFALPVGFVDPVTGRLLNQSGAELTLPPPVIDVAESSASDQIEMALRRGFFEAKDGRVHPNQEVGRGEAIHALVRAMGLPPRPDMLPYPDISPGNPLFDDVGAAVHARILVSKPGEKFGPDTSLTLGELFTWLAKAKMPKQDLSLSVIQAASDAAFQQYIDYAVNQKLLQSGERPKTSDKVTRAQLAIVLASELQPPREPTELLSVYLKGNTLALALDGYAPFQAAWGKMSDQRHLVIDLRGAVLSQVLISSTIKPSAGIQGVTAELLSSYPATTRVTVELTQSMDYEVKYGNGWLNVTFGKPVKKTINALKPLAGMVIAMDAGHGGNEPGATASSGRLEKEFNGEITQLVAKKLADKGAQVVMTRADDATVSLHDRPKQALSAGADLFISLHCDSFYLPEVVGSTAFYEMERTMQVGLAQQVYKSYVAATGRKNRGVKEEDFHVLRDLAIPAVLLELGFISNTDEEKTLQDPVFQEKAATGIVDGVVNYMRDQAR